MQHKALRQVNLDEVLAAKEKRAAIQRELREAYQTPLVSITVNMPGSVKYSEDTAGLLYRTADKVRGLINSAGLTLLEERLYHLSAGPAAVMAVRGAAAVLKDIGVLLEDGLPYGRLIDIDIFDEQGVQISRDSRGEKQRTCFICSDTAVACMRSGRHTPEEIMAAAAKLLTQYKAEKTETWPRPVATIGTAALQAALAEAACTPAPGLVDRHNSGAHQDMDFFSFLLSSCAIGPAFYQCAMAGWEHRGGPEGLLPVLRLIGAGAERRMFAATGGVNTQKGLLFLLGVVAAAAALVLRREQTADPIRILAAASGICRGIVDRELAALKGADAQKKLTAGELLFVRYGITGVRGEIEAGLPVISNKGLPALRRALAAGAPLNDALVHALMAIMSQTQDTTILNRHDIATLGYVREEAAAVSAMGGMLTAQGRERIKELDEIFISRNISPGGAADLLAVTYFLHIIDADPEFAAKSASSD